MGANAVLERFSGEYPCYMSSQTLRKRIALLAVSLMAPIALGASEANAAACNESVATFVQLQSAFTACNSGGGGVITVTADIDTTARLNYTGAGTLTIQSDQIGTLRRIRATGTRSWGVLESSAGPLIIDSLEITGGNGTSYGTYGGGIQGNRNLTVRNSYIHDNSGSTGGGLGLASISDAAPWKTFDLQYSRVESNTSTATGTTSGGGYFSLRGYETATITGSSFMYNQVASVGSALAFRLQNIASVYTITNSTIAYNRAISNSVGYGAVSYDYGTLFLNFDTFNENSVAVSSGKADIYCATNNQCSMRSVGSIFANSSSTGTCSINATARYATYSVSNIDTSTGYSCLNNINSSGVRQTALEATNVVSSVVNMYLSPTAALNGGTTPNFAITNSASKLIGVVPSSVGSLYTTIDQRGVARTGSSWSAGAYERSSVATASNIGLSFPAGPVVYRQSKTLTATSDSAPGKITFLANGKRIAGCINKSTSSSNSYTVTCSWKPSVRGAVVLSAVFTPADSDAFSPGISTPLYVGVSNRSSIR